MRNLTDALKQVERNDPPDLWPLVQSRDVRALAPSVETHPRRWSTILVAAVISILALGFAWKAFGSGPVTAGAEPTATTSSSDSTPSVDGTIHVQNGPEHRTGADSGEFAPPPAGSQPALSAHEALDVFFQDNPGIQFNQSDIRSLSIGSYTSVQADGSYLFQDRLAYGVELHTCATLAPPSCDLWIFLDADTGHMLESAWRP